MDCIRYWDGARLQYLFVELFLLHLVQLVFQLCVVDRIAKLVSGNRVDDFFAERILFPKFVPTARLSAYLDRSNEGGLELVSRTWSRPPSLA